MTISDDRQVAFFAQTNFRSRIQRFGIYQADRRAHTYVIGKTGSGKSTLLETLIRQDLDNGCGLALLDPHGDLAQRIFQAIPENRKSNAFYFDATNRLDPPAFNPLEQVPASKFSLAASGLIAAFHTLWNDFWGPRLEHILRHAILALLETPGSTLADILRLMEDNGFRKATASRLGNARVRDFWLSEYEHYNSRFRTEAIAPIQNKVGAFLADPILHRILTQPKSSMHLRQLMDSGGVLVVNLAKGQIGYDSSRLLGALILSRIGLSALSRADQPLEQRRDFMVYLDEFQSYTTLELALMLSELRKYRVGLILAHQYLSQLDLQIRDAVLGNVGTIVSFRLGLADAEIVAKEFHPVFHPSDLISLPNYHIYLKLMIDGKISEPFSAQTLPPEATPQETTPAEISGQQLLPLS